MIIIPNPRCYPPPPSFSLFIFFSSTLSPPPKVGRAREERRGGRNEDRPRKICISRGDGERNVERCKVHNSSLYERMFARNGDDKGREEVRWFVEPRCAADRFIRYSERCCFYSLLFFFLFLPTEVTKNTLLYKNEKRIILHQDWFPPFRISKWSFQKEKTNKQNQTKTRYHHRLNKRH